MIIFTTREGILFSLTFISGGGFLVYGMARWALNERDFRIGTNFLKYFHQRYSKMHLEQILKNLLLGVGTPYQKRLVLIPFRAG